jgi:hypothetical protein
MQPDPGSPWPLTPLPPPEPPSAGPSPPARVAGLFALGAGCGLLVGGGSLFALLAVGCRGGGGATSSRAGFTTGVAAPASPAAPGGVPPASGQDPRGEPPAGDLEAGADAR